MNGIWRFVLAMAMVMGDTGAAGASAPIRLEVCGLRIAVDADSGGVRTLEYAGATLLDATAENASLLDAAYPGLGFDPLRIGTRYSRGARVDRLDGGICITWDALGLSRAIETPGNVAASVTIRPMHDGRSVALQATIDNQSSVAIPQVLFPDFEGLLPFAGDDGTELRTCGFVKKPFIELKPPEDEGRWYASRRNWLELTSGAYDKSMAARWLDFGALHSGFSLFPKLWSWGPLNASNEPTTDHVLLHLSQTTGTLRMMCEHRVTIKPGEQWTSPEYVLTPRQHGWAKGIEPFRAWVNENVQRPYPLPERLHQTLGYRSVWMAQQYANADPAEPTVVWRFRDLPGLAEESREHGLNEMVLWLWQPWEIPDQPAPELGTVDEFTQAIAACREKGVNVSLFVSVMTMLDPIPARYGWNDAMEYWGYHSDFVPMLRPYYGTASRGSFADQSHPQWQADISASLLKLVERGWTSITWDQARYAPSKPNIVEIFARARAAAKAADPESTFAAEDLNNIDLDSRWLDYTWNWALFDENLDWRALVNAYPTPRFNVNVGTSTRTVKRCFVDHLFLNVLPSRPEGINGSARIAEYPQLSQALKTCAALHAQFRPYWEEGVLVGDCILTAPCEDARINGYVLPDRALIVAINSSSQMRSVAFECDLAPWLKSPSSRYEVRLYNEQGMYLGNRVEDIGSWKERLTALQADELVPIEIIPLD